jgi:hypothetical protein
VEVEDDHLLEAPREPVAAPITRLTPVPSRARAARQTGTTDTAVSSACATSSVAGWEEPEERRYQRHDGLEVITQQVEAGSPDRDPPARAGGRACHAYWV